MDKFVGEARAAWCAYKTCAHHMSVVVTATCMEHPLALQRPATHRHNQPYSYPPPPPPLFGLSFVARRLKGPSCPGRRVSFFELALGLAGLRW